jgi:prepilin-type N-terminal cleavage/methylation domain-containing protein
MNLSSKHSILDRNTRQSRGRKAFTLIELLTVISIIAIIAGLLVGLAPVAARSMRLKRVESDLQQITTAIERYKDKFGHYPPDHITGQLPSGLKAVNPEINQLFYELTGFLYTSTAPSDGVIKSGGIIYTNSINRIFGRLGFVNSSTDAKEVMNFLPNLNAAQTATLVSGASQYDVLAVPVNGPRDYAGLNGVKVNPWRYVTSNPTNNPNRFDLWAEIKVGKEIKIIGNWKQ